VVRKLTGERLRRPVSEERRSLLDPDSFLERIGVAPGFVVADLGAGPGFFTVPLAARVGLRGTVYALDVDPAK
jgi:tRNA A58 N-methylase Trm61